LSSLGKFDAVGLQYLLMIKLNENCVVMKWAHFYHQEKLKK